MYTEIKYEIFFSLYGINIYSKPESEIPLESASYQQKSFTRLVNSNRNKTLLNNLESRVGFFKNAQPESESCIPIEIFANFPELRFSFLCRILDL